MLTPTGFYDMQADGYSLDDKRTPPSFLVPKAEIAANDYDLSINRYKEVTYEAVEHEPPQVILERLAKLEVEIAEGRKELEELLALDLAAASASASASVSVSVTASTSASASTSLSPRPRQSSTP